MSQVCAGLLTLVALRLAPSIPILPFEFSTARAVFLMRTRDGGQRLRSSRCSWVSMISSTLQTLTARLNPRLTNFSCESETGRIVCVSRPGVRVGVAGGWRNPVIQKLHVLSTKDVPSCRKRVHGSPRELIFLPVEILHLYRKCLCLDSRPRHSPAVPCLLVRVLIMQQTVSAPR